MSFDGLNIMLFRRLWLIICKSPDRWRSGTGYVMKDGKMIPSLRWWKIGWLQITWFSHRSEELKSKPIAYSLRKAKDDEGNVSRLEDR